MRRGAILFFQLALATTVAAGELQDDLRARRARALEALGPEAMLVLRSAPTANYSRDVDYEYRQDSNLLYLTGVAQEGTTLVLMPGNKARTAILFVSDPDPRREHREGHLLTKQEATALSGIEHVHHASEFDAFLGQIMNRRPFGVDWGRHSPEYDAFFGALQAGRARLALALGPRPRLGEPLPPLYELAQKARERFLGVTVEDATDLLERLRQVKTPYERRVLARSVEISSEAHKAGMRAARPGRWEYEVESAIEAVYLASGAMSPGYPSIVASGPNATILHYGESSRQMKDGELLLVDAAASYQGLTGDITRTYPVNGRFSPAQREIYELVLAAQEAGMKAAQAGRTTFDIERAAAEVAKQGLVKLGLVTDASGEQFRTWYTHGVCHWIGMDVHDAGDYKRPLEPGMAFVIEPGIYIREAALEQLPDTPENRVFKEKVRPALARYKDIGVRIEDSFLLTESGLQRLSAQAPRTVAEVEAFMKGR